MGSPQFRQLCPKRLDSFTKYFSVYKILAPWKNQPLPIITSRDKVGGPSFSFVKHLWGLICCPLLPIKVKMKNVKILYIWSKLELAINVYCRKILDMLETSWKKAGLDSVSRSTYNFLLSFPDKQNPNKINLYDEKDKKVEYTSKTYVCIYVCYSQFCSDQLFYLCTFLQRYSELYQIFSFFPLIKLGMFTECK